jgi:hypothetical protein
VFCYACTPFYVTLVGQVSVRIQNAFKGKESLLHCLSFFNSTTSTLYRNSIYSFVKTSPLSTPFSIVDLKVMASERSINYVSSNDNEGGEKETIKMQCRFEHQFGVIVALLF